MTFNPFYYLLLCPAAAAAARCSLYYATTWWVLSSVPSSTWDIPDRNWSTSPGTNSFTGISWERHNPSTDWVRYPSFINSIRVVDILRHCPWVFHGWSFIFFLCVCVCVCVFQLPNRNRIDPASFSYVSSAGTEVGCGSTASCRSRILQMRVNNRSSSALIKSWGKLHQQSLKKKQSKKNPWMMTQLIDNWILAVIKKRRWCVPTAGCTTTT